MTEEEKNKFYIEFELHIDEPLTVKELTAMSDEFIEFTKKWNCFPPKARIIKNPTYDSFGNLWE